MWVRPFSRDRDRGRIDEAEARQGRGRLLEAEARPRQNFRGRGKAENYESNLSYRKNSVATENNVKFYTDYDL